MTADRCTLLPWDTEFWGTRIGRVADGKLDVERTRGVDEWAAGNGVRCLYYLVDADDVASAHAAEAAGFRLMDVRVELARPAGRIDPPPDVRAGRADDLPALRAIARTGHVDTRFYADPNFPNDRCDDLYDAWLIGSFNGLAAAVLVAERDGDPIGYVSCRDEGASASIGLIGVHAEARRRGIGGALVLGAVDWAAANGFSNITVVTQGRNVAAQRTFTSSGFRPTATGLWFHKWYDA